MAKTLTNIVELAAGRTWAGSGGSAYRDGECYSYFSPQEREILKGLE